MSNGEKTNKPIDLYNMQFEDPSIMEQDDLQELINQLTPQGVTPLQVPEQQTISDASR